MTLKGNEINNRESLTAFFTLSEHTDKFHEKSIIYKALKGKHKIIC